MAQTIRKNTKAHAAALAAAKDVTVFSLDNYFNGKPLAGPIATYDVENGKLVRRGETLSLRVHGNLWYEWKAA